MSGTIIGNLRTIALSTTVSLLLPSEEHAKANGKIGTINGVWFTLTSVASGLVIWFLWMGWAIAWAAVIMLLVIGHLLTFTIPEKTIFSAHTDDQQAPSKKLNIRETIATIQEIPWLFALIFFTTFNNFLWWVFMALMDPYGLLLVPVQTRWMMFAVASLAFIAAGIFIAKKWLGKNPLRTIFIVNICMWITCIYFTIQPSAILIFSGMIIWMFCSPFAEASESTVLQKVVPYKKQGRVFGIAQSIESMAMPITALLIGPIAELIFIPLMSEGWRGANAIGSWFGTGTGRGIAVVFILAGIIWLIVTLLAYKSKYYPLLTKSYLANKNKPAEIDITTPAEVGIN
jgi:DHA3 family multidrug efflux protein-like MFS transporter